MIVQLNPPLPMWTPKGEGFCHFMIDYGPESDLYWTVIINDTGEIWTYANKEVRAQKNITLGCTHPQYPSTGDGRSPLSGQRQPVEASGANGVSKPDGRTGNGAMVDDRNT